MRKIRLSDTDLEFFDMEIAPTEFMFYSKHKDAFRTMWKEQGKPFWTRFVITFRSFTVKHGVIKQMSIDTPKFENLIDQAFIFIHEQFVDGKDNTAKNFLEDVARLAQNQDKFPALDSKSFSKDPFYLRDTRDLFRRFFGPPDQKSSYLKVYILCPVYMRFGGSVCRCLIKWIDAPEMNPSDDSYWTPPQRSLPDRSEHKHCRHELVMCNNCVEDSNTRFFQEKILGDRNHPKFVTQWDLGDPRLKDPHNPLFAPHADPDSDWRDDLTIETFKDFYSYCRDTYGTVSEQCGECLRMKENHKLIVKACHTAEKKKKNKKKKKDKKSGEDKKAGEDCETKDRLVLETNSNNITETLEKVSIHVDMVERHTELKKEKDDLPAIRTGALVVSDESGPKKGKATKRVTTLEETEIFTCKAHSESVFSRKAKVSDDFKYGVIPAGDIGTKKNLIGGFKIIRIEEEKSGALEIIVTVAEVKSEAGVMKDKPFLKQIKGSSEYNLFPLNEELVKTKIEGLPAKFEWWEGIGWACAVLNYEEEEKHKTDKPTNFSVKVTGIDEDIIKRTMFKLLFYVAKRKKRPCPGWFMDDDDVVTCILPDDTPEYEGITITIQKGFRFEERLTAAEKASKLEPVTISPEITAALRGEKPLNKVLLTLEKGTAAKMLRAENGRESLKELLNRISGDTNDHEDAQLPIGDGSTLHLTKGAPPIIDVRASAHGKLTCQPEQGNLWDRMMNSPENFELYIMVNKDIAPELMKHGMKQVKMDQLMEEEEKPKDDKTCSFCHRAKSDCCCKFKLVLPPEGMSYSEFVEQKLRENEKKMRAKDIAKRLKAIESPDLTLDMSILEQMAEHVPEHILQRMEYRKKEKEDQERKWSNKQINDKSEKKRKLKELKAIKEKEREKEAEEKWQKEFRAAREKEIRERVELHKKFLEDQERNEQFSKFLLDKLGNELRQEEFKEACLAQWEITKQKRYEEEDRKRAEEDRKREEKRKREEEKMLKEKEEEQNGEEDKMEIETEEKEKKEDIDQEEEKEEKEEKFRDDMKKEDIEEDGKEKEDKKIEENDEDKHEENEENGMKVEVDEEEVKETKLEEKKENREERMNEIVDEEKREQVIEKMEEDKGKRGESVEEKEEKQQVTQEMPMVHTEKKEGGKVDVVDLVIDDPDQARDLGEILEELKHAPPADDLLPQPLLDNLRKGPLVEAHPPQNGSDSSADKAAVHKTTSSEQDVKDKIVRNMEKSVCKENGSNGKNKKQTATDSDGSDDNRPSTLVVGRLNCDSNGEWKRLLNSPIHELFSHLRETGNTKQYKVRYATKEEKAKMEEERKRKAAEKTEKALTDTPASPSDKSTGPSDKLEAVDEKSKTTEEKLEAEKPKEKLVTSDEKPETSEPPSPTVDPKQQLKNCSNCGSVEPTRKAYKKCQKCKSEGVVNTRYYCGRDCQVADWNNRHKREHKEKLLV